MLVVAALVVLGSVMAFHAADAEIRKAGVGLLTAILSGVLGFMAGRGLR